VFDQMNYLHGNFLCFWTIASSDLFFCCPKTWIVSHRELVVTVRVVCVHSRAFWSWVLLGNVVLIWVVACWTVIRDILIFGGNLAMAVSVIGGYCFWRVVSVCCLGEFIKVCSFEVEGK
jgi:hypothetical protein